MTSEPNPGFDAGTLEQRYAFLDDCPEQFLNDIVTLPVGTLPERVQGIRSWRDALLDGRLPPAGTWPPTAIAGPARLAIETLRLLRFCKGQPELTDAFLRDVLESFKRNTALQQAEVSERLGELERLERKRIHEESRRAARLDPSTLERLRQQALREAALCPPEQDRQLVAAWSERARAWASISDVFGDIGTIMGRGWDLSQGILKHSGWLDLVRLRALIEQLPQVREIVRSLGRLHDSDAKESVAEVIFEPVKRLEEETREVWTRQVPAETRGVERSGEIARMLPVEAVNLGHPRLRYLWHARRAERALLSYRVEGIELERTLVEHQSDEPIVQQRPRPERGPILAVVDTSGSMHGLPERVAKALVLEALRTAHAEKRRCFVYTYSGPGQVLEQELDLSRDGIGRLFVFLGQSFGGGNDETGVIAKVVRRLDEQGWRKADVVVVSDGEWPAPAELTRLVEQARRKGARFHGVQIGNRGQTGLHAICDPVHEFRDWAAIGGW